MARREGVALGEGATEDVGDVVDAKVPLDRSYPPERVEVERRVEVHRPDPRAGPAPVHVLPAPRHVPKPVRAEVKPPLVLPAVEEGPEPERVVQGPSPPPPLAISVAPIVSSAARNRVLRGWWSPIFFLGVQPLELR